MRRWQPVVSSVFAQVLALGLLMVVVRPLAAQGERSSLYVRVNVASDSYNAIRENPVMVSLIRDGAVVMQRELNLNSGDRFYAEPGTYDLRLEGDGMVTLVKKGLQVFPGQETQIVGGPMRAGTGVRIVEYATGGLSREEVAARLANLDAQVAELQKAVKKP